MAALLLLTGPSCGASEKVLPLRNVEDFTDVPAVPWYYMYISRATDMGLFYGTSSTTFSPEQPITRAEAVTVLARIHEKLTEKPVGKDVWPGFLPHFRDVFSKSYYSGAVEWATKNQLIPGWDQPSFYPDSGVTHSDFAMLFHKYLEMVGKAGLYPSKENRFEDQDTIPDWAIPHVQAISGFEIFQGKTFDPEAETLRSEAVALFVRMYEKAVYPVDVSTPRQSYKYSSTIQESPPFLPVGENHWKVISTYEEYQGLLRSLYTGRKLQQIEQPVHLDVSSSTFEENALLAVEVQEEGAPAFKCEFGELTVMGDTATVTLIKSNLYGSTGDLDGILFIAPVSKNIVRAEIVCLSWVEDTYDVC